MARVNQAQLRKFVDRTENLSFTYADKLADLSKEVSSALRGVARYDDSDLYYRLLKQVNDELKDAVAAAYRAHLRAKALYQELNK